mmetsp:Transcript_91826/g.259329  ORF Transcript_91826/g.259329 Transcript_91826/m.259329 type:complete len:201 (+) Transcript_91826:210-812(+)
MRSPFCWRPSGSTWTCTPQRSPTVCKSPPALSFVSRTAACMDETNTLNLQIAPSDGNAARRTASAAAWRCARQPCRITTLSDGHCGASACGSTSILTWNVVWMCLSPEPCLPMTAPAVCDGMRNFVWACTSAAVASASPPRRDFFGAAAVDDCLGRRRTFNCACESSALSLFGDTMALAPRRLLVALAPIAWMRGLALIP